MTAEGTPILIVSSSYWVEGADERVAARSKALRRATDHASYNVDSNFLGVVGELATLAHLRVVLPPNWSVEWVGDSAADPADVLVRSSSGRAIGLEVKTTTADRWKRHGRIVGADQLYATTARAYIWCVAERALRMPDVLMLGWSPTAEMRQNWSTATFTGMRKEVLRQELTADPVLSEPEPVSYLYDIDDVDLDEYDLRALEWDRRTAAHDSVPVPSCDAVVAAALDAGGVPSAADWREGSEPLDGFGKMRELVKVESDLRRMGTLPPWLMNQAGRPSLGPAPRR